MDFEQEVSYFSRFYKKKGDLKEIINFNSDLAEQKKKHNVSLFWKNLLNIFFPHRFPLLDPLKTLSSENFGPVSPSYTNENQKSTLKEEDDQLIWNQMTPNSQSIQRLCDLKTPDSVAVHAPKQERAESQMVKSEEPEIDLEMLYDYFERFGEKFQQELELKNIMIEEDAIFIRKNCLADYNRSLLNSNSIEERKQDESWSQISQMTSSTLLGTLQSLIDEGELLHAFQIYLAIRTKIQIPDKQVRLWSHSYIELLRTNNLHKTATECVKTSQIPEIKNTNKVIYHQFSKSLNK